MNILNEFASAYMDGSCYDLESEKTIEFYTKRILNISPKGSLLELGIGFGLSTIMFSSNFNRHVVVEGSDEVINRFKQNYNINNIEIYNSLFEDFNTNEKFDVIIMGFILEHVENPELILKQYKKHLKKISGRLYVAVPNALSLHRRIGYAAGLMENLYQFNDYDKKAGHKRYFDINSIRKLLLDCGYKICRCEGVLLKPITTKQMEQLNLSEKIINGMFQVGLDFPELSNSILIEARY